MLRVTNTPEVTRDLPWVHPVAHLPRLPERLPPSLPKFFFPFSSFRFCPKSLAETNLSARVSEKANFSLAGGWMVWGEGEMEHID